MRILEYAPSKTGISNGVKVTLLSTPGCIHCHEVKTFLEKIKPDFPDLQIEEIDMLTPEGQVLVEKHQIMASPGVFLDGELIGVGGVNKDGLLQRLQQKGAPKAT